MEMPVRTAQTPGSVSCIGWSANLRATARISSVETEGALGGEVTQQEAASLAAAAAAALGVTISSPTGSGAIARARARRIPAPEPRAVAGEPTAERSEGSGTGGWGTDCKPGELVDGRRHGGSEESRGEGVPAFRVYIWWGFARVMFGSAGPLDEDQVVPTPGRGPADRAWSVSRKEPR